MNGMSGTSWFEEWEESVLRGGAPELWPCGEDFSPVEIGPGLVMLLGGAPGVGKTALAMQLTVDSLRLNQSLRCVVANVEMSPHTLMDRQLSRLSGINAGRIRLRDYDRGGASVHAVLNEIRRISPRLDFHTGPPTLVDVFKRVKDFGANLVVLDYVQRFSPGTDPGQGKDKRSEIDDMMTFIRRLANQGVGVILVSAVARQASKGGSDYNDLGLASFRGSSELEYGADSAWIMSGSTNNITFACHKNRHGRTPWIKLCFQPDIQTFTVIPTLVDQVESHFRDKNPVSQSTPRGNCVSPGSRRRIRR